MLFIKHIVPLYKDYKIQKYGKYQKPKPTRIKKTTKTRERKNIPKTQPPMCMGRVWPWKMLWLWSSTM